MSKQFKSKKHKDFNTSFSGEYHGIEYVIERKKMDKATYKQLKKAGKKPTKVIYAYKDGDVSRNLNKRLYNNLLKKSEVLYDEKKGKYVRY